MQAAGRARGRSGAGQGPGAAPSVSLLGVGARGPAAGFHFPLLISRLWAFAHHAGLADRACLMPRTMAGLPRGPGLISGRACLAYAGCCPPGRRGNAPFSSIPPSRVGDCSVHSESGWKSRYFSEGSCPLPVPFPDPSVRLQGSQPGDKRARVTAIGVRGQEGHPTWAEVTSCSGL